MNQATPRWTIGRQITCGVALVIGFIIMLAAIAQQGIRELSEAQRRNVDAPQHSVEAALEVKAGLKKAESGLHGYLAAGDQQYQTARAEGIQQTDKALARLKEQSGRLNPQDAQMLQELMGILGQLRASEDAVAEINGQDGAAPAQQMLLGETSPLGESMLSTISRMIEEENRLEKTPRRQQLLGELTEARQSLIAGLVSIYKFLTTAQEQHAEEFRSHWSRNQQAVASLNDQAWMFTPQQQQMFSSFQQSRSRFESMPERFFALRKSDGWNVARQQLAGQVAPQQAQASALVDQLIDNTRTRVAKGRANVARKAAGAPAIIFLVAAGMVGVAGFVGLRLARRISGRIARMNVAAEKAAAGDLSQRLPLEGRDDLTSLALSVNQVLETTSRMLRKAEKDRQQPAPASTAMDQQQLEQMMTQLRGVVGQMNTSGVALDQQAQSTAATGEALEHLQNSIAQVQQTAEQITEMAQDASSLTDTTDEGQATDTRRIAQSSQRLNQQAVELQKLAARLSAAMSPASAQEAAPQNATQPHVPHSPATGPVQKKDSAEKKETAEASQGG